MSTMLVLVTPEGKQTEIPLRKPVQIIGRQTDCQIRIPSAAVSRHHCEVAVEKGIVSVRDLGSSNGTFVNKRKVAHTDLAPGDLISVGGLVFVVRVDGRPAAIEAEDVIEDGLVPVPAPGALPSPTARAKPQVQAKPTPKQSILEEADSGGSSVDEFDFFNEEDDFKKQPKL